ncbi:D-cysteine desulfhydrase family protein [Alteromonas sp. C1M14]|uniref:D-cysteine desulfhydrase family protein n=1 Tax=Alteromonas sp. C1M14 TaxID=2841567 RepID=UPI001C094722|nr:D-cysteine desulfhydrase family protein [Alteromonas sp. C1M14]MBU2978672.1 D-cysteine desulfhydrase family protein [Alteromonas sp. C1M14]
MDLIRFPRIPLAFLPTPLMPMPRLQAHLGPKCPALFIKRDDCTGLAQGGNKTRKLEFLLGDALAKNADVIITSGALQSNHVRQTAAACAAKGLKCVVVLSQSVPRTLPVYIENGNLLLDDILGAQVHRVDSADDVAPTINVLVNQLTAAGQYPYVIPTGGSNCVGALGYVNAVQECIAQCSPQTNGQTYVVHASASGGTQAGLVAGNAMLGNPLRVVGVNVYKQDNQAVLANIQSLVTQIQQDCQLSFSAKPEFTLWHGYQGEAYGIPTEAGNHAVLTLAQQEGILADPVYSGKALAGLMDKCASGHFSAEDRVIFLHTGGATALHAYPDILHS